jgi:hypothetical protein
MQFQINGSAMEEEALKVGGSRNKDAQVMEILENKIEKQEFFDKL